jgi:hypothetical protein
LDVIQINIPDLAVAVRREGVRRGWPFSSAFAANGFFDGFIITAAGGRMEGAMMMTDSLSQMPDCFWGFWRIRQQPAPIHSTQNRGNFLWR